MKIVAPRLGVRFMNLGYWPSSKPEDDKLRRFIRGIDDLQDYESHKSHVYLYEKAMSMHPAYPDFENLEILEVSCGQGYSLEWIEKWHGPTKSLIGCDKVVTRNVNNIVYGDAADLPFADETFDFGIKKIQRGTLYTCFQY